MVQFETIYSQVHSDMYKYIKKEWIDSNYCNWQIFRNKSGFANTNSNLESFNNTVKRIFTKRQTFYISGAISKIAEVILYYSANKHPFKDYPKHHPKVVEQAKKLTKDNFKHKERNIVRYNGKNNKFTIRLDDLACYNNASCDCSGFMKEAICMHLLGYSNVHSLELCGPEYNVVPKSFSIQMKRGKPVKSNRYGIVNQALRSQMNLK